LLGWWGRARSADRAPGSGGTVFRAKPPFRSREGGRRGEVRFGGGAKLARRPRFTSEIHVLGIAVTP
jgi:hypothetical protein